MYVKNSRGAIGVIVALLLVVCVAVGGVVFYIAVCPRNPASVFFKGLSNTSCAESFDYELDYSPISNTYSITGTMYKALGKTAEEDVYYFTADVERLLTDKSIVVRVLDNSYRRDDTVLKISDSVSEKYTDYLNSKWEKARDLNSMTGTLAALFELAVFFPSDLSAKGLSATYEKFSQMIAEDKNITLVDSDTAAKLVKGFVFDTLNDKELQENIFVGLSDSKDGSEKSYSFTLDLDELIDAVSSYCEENGCKESAESLLAVYSGDFDSLKDSLSTSLKLAGYEDNCVPVSFTVEGGALTSVEVGDFFAADFSDIDNAISREDALSAIAE